MRHLHQVRLYLIKGLSCAGTAAYQNVPVEFQPPEIQRHLHVLAQNAVEIFVLVRKYLVCHFG